ncbi:MAG: hypothetical protein J3R72DRAFT_480467 [Linnemannia gamsii]|nr:MAG: hypothetical protein J3R72DRAFT_480467 [Linnemannia gamsii]
MILKRNPAGSAGSPTRQESPYGSSNSYNNNSYSNSSRQQQQQQGYGQRDEEMDDLGDYVRRQMSGLSLHERNRVLWDEAELTGNDYILFFSLLYSFACPVGVYRNAYEQPIIARADTTRTEYVPEIRILRRPQTPVQQTRVSNQAKSKPLAQREADYNAAREKIFGPSPTPSSPSNDTSTTTSTNLGMTGGGGGGSRSPRRQSPSVTGGSGSLSSPNSRPPSRPSSRPASPSTQHQTIQLYTARSTGAFENALETVKPIEFRGGPPPSRRGGGGGGGSGTGGGGGMRGGGSGQEGVNTVIRQPMGPTSPSSGHSGGSGSKPRGRGRGRGGGNSSSSGGGGKSASGGGGGSSEGGGGGGDVGSTTNRQEGSSIGFRRPMGRGGSNINQPRPTPPS